MTNRTHHPIRMCARCERTTDTPVLVHEVRAATGPGFNVYACRECADHYPPLTETLELPEETPTSRLTLRVYKINPHGTVTEDHGKVEVLAGKHTDPPPHTSASHHAAASAAARDRTSGTTTPQRRRSDAEQQPSHRLPC
jgi:hypothetical protein